MSNRKEAGMTYTTWPIAETGNYRVYFALTVSGVAVFSISDWQRGEADIDNRAYGYVSGRRVLSLRKAGCSQVPVNDECYPDIGSAALRWPEITERLSQPCNCDYVWCPECGPRIARRVLIGRQG